MWLLGSHIPINASLMKLTPSNRLYLIKAIKYIMLFFAIGWLSHTIWQEIMLVDQQVEASYPTMNQDFGKLISYLIGKIVRTLIYIIVIIPSMIYGSLPLPRSFRDNPLY